MSHENNENLCVVHSFTRPPPPPSARPPDLHPGPSLHLLPPSPLLSSVFFPCVPVPLLLRRHLLLFLTFRSASFLLPAFCVSPLFLTFAVSPSRLAVQTAADSALLLIHSKVGQSLGQWFLFFFRRQNFVLKASPVSQGITGDPPSPRPRWLPLVISTILQRDQH